MPPAAGLLAMRQPQCRLGGDRDVAVRRGKLRPETERKTLRDAYKLSLANSCFNRDRILGTLIAPGIGDEVGLTVR
jgi:hypothetical protein